MKNKKQLSAENLAVEFSKILRAWLGPNRMKQVIEKNATPEYADCCASHDYCDANEAMDEAFVHLRGKGMSVQNKKDVDLFNRAWGIAKANKFATA